MYEFQHVPGDNISALLLDVLHAEIEQLAHMVVI